MQSCTIIYCLVRGYPQKIIREELKRKNHRRVCDMVASLGTMAGYYLGDLFVSVVGKLHHVQADEACHGKTKYNLGTPMRASGQT